MRALFTLLAFAALAASGAGAQKIAVVTSDQPAFAEAARAAVDALGADAQLLRADDASRPAIQAATVTIAVGPLADRIVAGATGPRAAVACLTPRSTNGALLVPLRPSPDEVLMLVRTAVPDARSVGVFGATDAAALQGAARSAGLTLVLPRAGEAFAAAVDRLAGASDVLWIEDAGDLPSGGAQLVIKRGSESNKPVIGSNRAAVLQGALLAVVPDPVTHGRAAAEAARQLERGEAVHSIAPPPGRVLLNGPQAKTRGIKLPPAVARRTETVQ